MQEFVSRLGDTVLWALIGASVLASLLKLVQSIQTSFYRRQEKHAVIKVEQHPGHPDLR